MATGGTQTSVDAKVSAGGPAYYKDALKDLGVLEWVLDGKRKRPNPAVQRIIEKGGGGDQFDCIDQPWCAWYINGKLAFNGANGTRSGMARSFLKWGVPVEEADAKKGDIVVLWRGPKNDGVTGHVGMLVDLKEDSFTLLGGNQGDKVCIETFSRHKNGRDRILGIRRPRHWTESRKVRAAGTAATVQVTGKALELALPDPSVTPVKPAVKAATKAVEFIDQSQGQIDMVSQFKPWIPAVVALVTVALLGYIAWRNFADQKEKGT